MSANVVALQSVPQVLALFPELPPEDSVSLANPVAIADAIAIALVRDGDASKLGELVGRYERRLQHYVRGLVRDEERARELVQEVFIRVWRKAHQFQPKATFATWLFRIAHNVAVSDLRRKRLPLIPLGVPDDDSGHVVADVVYSGRGPDELAESRQLGEKIRIAMDQLPDKLREAFVLFDVEERTIAEIAELTNSPTGTVKARIFRARRALRKLLAESVGREPEAPETIN